MTKEVKNKEISIGWDVGGWSGRNHGLCILKNDEDKIEVLRAGAINVYDVKSTIEEIITFYSHETKITIAIDAPLQFPQLFKDLILKNQNLYFDQIRKQHNKNPMAWRATDLYIKERFKKNPLSASFSFLTSNATVAIALIGELTIKFPQLAVLPFDSYSNLRCIEVYPGLLKSSVLKQTSHFVNYKELLSSILFDKITGFEYYFEGSKEKTDTADAVICALYGLGISSENPAIPPLEMNIPENYIETAKNEGWIYFPKLP